MSTNYDNASPSYIQLVGWLELMAFSAQMCYIMHKKIKVYARHLFLIDS